MSVSIFVASGATAAGVRMVIMPRTDQTQYFGVWQPHGQYHWVWRVANGVGARVGVPQALEHRGSHIRLAPGEEFEPAVIAMLNDFLGASSWKVREMNLPPGHFYKRMARPSDQHPDGAPGLCPGFRDYRHEFAIMQGQLLSLLQRLETICGVVHPEPANLEVYGHEMRNLLILACTEVETHWRAVLRANGVAADRLTTADYVQLQEAMRLGEYAMAFNGYPWLDPVRPFCDWGTTGSPTKELAWYDAYNSVKHDREDNFQNATLGHALEAVAACAIMFYAQVGRENDLRYRSAMNTFFTISSTPSWDYTEVYTNNYDGVEYTPVNYPFNVTTRKSPAKNDGAKF